VNPRELESVSHILPDEIARARSLAQASGKSAVDLLQEAVGLPAEGFVAALAATLGYEVLPMSEMDRLAPAFDLLPYTEALARGCLLFRNGGGELIFAFGDPFNASLRPLPWAW